MRKILGVLAFVGAQLLAGCGSSTGPKFGLSGFWTGVVNGQILSMTIIEKSGVITGSGTLTNTPTGTRAETVAGTMINDVVDVTFSSPPVNPFTLHGHAFVMNDQYLLDATLVGAGFTGETIRLVQFPPPQ